MKDRLIDFRAQNKEKNDFDHIYASYSSKIFKGIFLIIQDSSESKDLTNETFFKLYKFFKKKGKYPEKISAWLYRSSYNIACNYLRRKKLHNKILKRLKTQNHVSYCP